GGSAYVYTLRFTDGAACTDAAQCLSGFCVDGVCCDTACESSAMACTTAKKRFGEDGTCGAILPTPGPPEDVTYYSCEATPLSAASCPVLLAAAIALALAARARRRQGT